MLYLETIKYIAIFLIISKIYLFLILTHVIIIDTNNFAHQMYNIRQGLIADKIFRLLGINSV